MRVRSVVVGLVSAVLLATLGVVGGGAASAAPSPGAVQMPSRWVGHWDQHMGVVQVRANGTGYVLCRDCYGYNPTMYDMLKVSFKVVKVKGTRATVKVTRSQTSRFHRGDRFRLSLRAPGMYIPTLGVVGNFCDEAHYGFCGA